MSAWRSPTSRALFQFTPLREGRPTRTATSGRPEYFNSRPSARGDAQQVGDAGLLIISIHAPPRGATSSRRGTAARQSYFNSRPSARGDCNLDKRARRVQNFNSRPSARGDGKRYAISANLLFNPYKSAWLNNSATQFVEIILVIFHRIIA